MIGKLTLVFVAFIALATAAPGGWFGKKHEHHVIHVPYHVHTVHHHHVEKIPIYKEVPVIKHVPIIKHVPVIKHVPIPVYKEIHHEPIHHGGWW